MKRIVSQVSTICLLFLTTPANANITPVHQVEAIPPSIMSKAYSTEAVNRNNQISPACALMTPYLSTEDSFTTRRVDNNPIINRKGCCSWHGGVCGCRGARVLCCDGTLSPSCRC
jgi:hypothetical protein